MVGAWGGGREEGGEDVEVAATGSFIPCRPWEGVWGFILFFSGPPSDGL